MVRLFLTTILLLSSVYSYAETYKWVDEKGVMHFSDRPPASKKHQEEQEINISKNSSIVKKLIGTWLSAPLKSKNYSISEGEITWMINDDGTMIWLDTNGSQFPAEYSIKPENSLYHIDIKSGSNIIRTSFKFIDEQTMLVAMKKGWSTKDTKRLNLTEPNVSQITLKKVDSHGMKLDRITSFNVASKSRLPKSKNNIRKETKSKEDEEFEIEKVWNTFTNKLANKDIEGALEYIHDSKKAKYKIIFLKMKDNLSKEHSKKEELEINYIEDNYASADNIVMEGDVAFSYPVVLMKTHAGWKIYQL